MIKTQEMLNNPIRSIKAKVELYHNSALADTFYSNGALKELTLERVGENKFFGFGICHKANIKLIDISKIYNFTTEYGFKIFFDDGSGYICPFPKVNITEVHRDEKSGTLSITTYDAIYKGNEHTVEELALEGGYSVLEFANACALFLGLDGIAIEGLAEGETCFNTYFEEGANFGGYESIREALNGVADATQTIYFIRGNTLVFKRPSMGEVAYTIYPKDYFEFKSGENRRITAVTSATELGDNITATDTLTGTNVYIRENPFWVLREDLPELVDNALAAVNGLTMAQVELEWRGNYLLEICDYIEILNREGKGFKTFLLNDSITYDGALKQETKWVYDEAEQGSTNPTSIGDAFKKTYAEVDKANREIRLVVEESNITNETVTEMGNALQELSTHLTQTAEDLKLDIERVETSGATSVTTTTNFTFNEEGLHISSTGRTEAELETIITEDGMAVKKEGKPVLTANNEGVEAIDLKCTTFLVIGRNSRLQDYGSNRTACYWIGG